MPRASADLKKQPVIVTTGELPEPPINRVTDELTHTSGEDLELSARVNPRLVNAVQVGFIFSESLHSDYVRGRIEQMLRLSVSMDGKGRQELIDTLSAGGQLPESYYNRTESGIRENKDFSYIKDTGGE